MIAQQGGNVNRIGAMEGGKDRKIPIQRGLYRWLLNYTLFDKIIRELRRVVRKIFEYRYKTKLLFVLKKNDL